MSVGEIFIAAAEVTRLAAILDCQSEPPHVGCYGARKGVEK